jgi:polysaccharide export outer membrane protein
MTEIAARDAISKSLSKYIKSPDISLRVQAFRSGRVYVEGEVRAPGVQAINDVPLSLSELLGRAGGLTALADRSSVFVTRDNTSTRINLVDLEQQKIEINSIFLSDKDTVRIASREDSKVYVLGEVTRPVTLLMRNTRMSLGEALGEAGGVNQLTGDPRNIYVLRSDADAKPYIFHLDASTPTNYLLANGFELLPRDLVFVDPTNLVRFNRVISLFLPSTQGVNSGVDLSRK